MLHQRLQLKTHAKKTTTAGTETGVQDEPALPKTDILWRNYVGDFRLVEFALHWRAPLVVPKEQKKQLDTFNPNTKPR